ncbi:hypothetical protein SLH46_05645 [Draconibacterium sp. IB214405]|uniref:hypothetical protein n=1 Tax=Draconibacterium sp. IB214405 TaxID=3097352 RepID=UPI002A1291D6|nr:hypothetical protein [Draconibacterium sp. IB214405]MDX8338655.1 hypothetical protein [Draconibacterium sp. IB214405]
MKIKSIFSKFVSWLKSPEVFGSKKKLIPGKWHLFEYYVDEGEELLHFDADALKKNKVLFVFSFLENHEFIEAGNAPVKILEGTTEGKWSIARNFITLINPKDFRNNIEFQYAFEKGNLKLLKKDAMGKIEFFGFFKRMKATS